MSKREPAPAPEFSFPVDVTQLPPLGREYVVTAKEAERQRVATRLDLVELPSLSAKVVVEPVGGNVRVSGHLNAEVVQACVVSLEPVRATISEDFELLFSRHARPAAADDDDELDLSVDDDPPELLTGDEIDLGEVAVEQLALFLDPYPRAPGAVFKNPTQRVEEPVAAKVSPFAVLAKLKNNNKSN